MFSFLFAWHMKNRDERQVSDQSGGNWKSRLELLSECTKLRVDEKLVAPDPDMFGYRFRSDSATEPS